MATLQQVNANLQTTLNTLLNAAPAAPAQQQPPIVTSTPFALTPATANVMHMIDFATKLGGSIYKQGIKKLTNDDCFLMMPATTVSFIWDLSNQCSIMGWNEGVMGITSFVNASNETIDLIKCYGHINEVTLKLHCKDFCKPGGARYQTRTMQNNHMMAQCLKNLLTASMAARLEPYTA